MSGERDGAVLDAIRADPSASQRELARLAKLSLGTINKVLRRLAEEGCLSIEGGRRARRYLVTPKGIAERARTVYASSLDAARRASLFEKTIQVEVMKEYAKGVRLVAVVGRTPLAELAGRAVMGLDVEGLVCLRAKELAELPPGRSLVLVDDAVGGSNRGARHIGELLASAGSTS